MAIIGSLAIFAIADNISDSLGIHIFQESDLKKSKVVRTSTFSNFFTRVSVTMVFILLVALFPIEYSIIFSIIWGLFLLTVLSYYIAKERKVNPYLAILQHDGIALVVIIASLFLREWIMNIFFKI